MGTIQHAGLEKYFAHHTTNTRILNSLPPIDHKAIAAEADVAFQRERAERAATWEALVADAQLEIKARQIRVMGKQMEELYF